MLNLTTRPRVALVGCGWFAHEAHIPALRRLESEGVVEVTAVCSRSASSRLRAKEALGKTNFPLLREYAVLSDVLRDDEVDLVILTLPINIMPDAIRTTLSAGKHVLSEKPCGPDALTCSELIQFHEELSHRSLWSVLENWRFKPTTSIIEDMVRSGEIGDIYFADFRNVTLHVPADSNWRSRPEYIGGHLLDSGVHFVALLRRLLGEVESVSALVRPVQAYLPPADTVAALMAFSGGVEATFRLSFAAEELNQPLPNLTLVGSKGAIYADFRRSRVSFCRGGTVREISVAEDSWVRGGVYEELKHCCDTLRLGTPHRNTPREARRDVAVVEAMLESSRRAAPVDPSSLEALGQLHTEVIDSFNGSWTGRPERLVECYSIDKVICEVKSAAASGRNIRAIGSASSWPNYISSGTICLRTSGLNRILKIDTVRKTILAEAGVRMGDINRALAAHGLSLPSLPSLPDITIGGAVATGSHGSSLRWGSISDSVNAVGIVTAAGDLKIFDGNSPEDELSAARVSAGMLGVIVTVELQVIPMPWVRYTVLRMTLIRFKSYAEEILRRYDHAWVFWSLGHDAVLVETLTVRTKSRFGFHRYVFGDNVRWAPPPSRWRGILGQNIRAAIRGVLRLFVGMPKVPSQPAEFSQHVWVSMQYGLPLASMGQAIDKIRLSEFARANEGRKLEIKFLRAGNSLIGSNAGADTVLFNAWWLVPVQHRNTVFLPFEAIMRELGGRPHWGKLHEVPTDDFMKASYSKWAAFRAVQSKFDPHGNFSFVEASDNPSTQG